MLVLGVHCSSGTAFFSLLEDGELRDSGPTRLTLPEAEDSDRLHTFVEDLGRSIRELKIDAVALLRAERQPPGSPGGRNVNVAALEKRTIMETLVRLAGIRAGIAVEVIERPTARARLGLDRHGKVEKMLDVAVPGLTGEYWGAGRGLAAVAARARIMG